MKLEKFQISQPKNFSAAENTTETDQENEPQDSLSNSSVNFFIENLVLYPNEDSHEISTIDLGKNLDDLAPSDTTNANNNAKMKSIAEDIQVGTTSPTKANESSGKMSSVQQGVNKVGCNKINMVKRDLFIEDETMMIDDFALISAKNDKNESKGISSYNFR